MEVTKLTSPPWLAPDGTPIVACRFAGYTTHNTTITGGTNSSRRIHTQRTQKTKRNRGEMRRSQKTSLEIKGFDLDEY